MLDTGGSMDPVVVGALTAIAKGASTPVATGVLEAVASKTTEQLLDFLLINGRAATLDSKQKDTLSVLLLEDNDSWFSRFVDHFRSTDERGVIFLGPSG